MPAGGRAFGEPDHRPQPAQQQYLQKGGKAPQYHTYRQVGPKKGAHKQVEAALRPAGVARQHNDAGEDHHQALDHHQRPEGVAGQAQAPVEEVGDGKQGGQFHKHTDVQPDQQPLIALEGPQLLAEFLHLCHALIHHALFGHHLPVPGEEGEDAADEPLDGGGAQGGEDGQAAQEEIEGDQYARAHHGGAQADPQPEYLVDQGGHGVGGVYHRIGHRLPGVNGGGVGGGHAGVVHQLELDGGPGGAQLVVELPDVGRVETAGQLHGAAGGLAHAVEQDGVHALAEGDAQPGQQQPERLHLGHQGLQIHGTLHMDDQADQDHAPDAQPRNGKNAVEQGGLAVLFRVAHFRSSEFGGCPGHRPVETVTTIVPPSAGKVTTEPGRQPLSYDFITFFPPA